MDAIIKFCAAYLILLPVLVVLFLEVRALRRHQFELVLFGVAAAFFAFILSKVGSSLITDPRPFVHDGTPALVSSAFDNGFPSDHTLIASICACIGWHFSRRLGLVLAVVAVAIGWGRVAAHVHHLEDLIGSFICAIVGYLIAVGMFRLYDSRRKPQAVSN